MTDKWDEKAFPDEGYFGLTKKELFSAMILQGLLSADRDNAWPAENIVEYAVSLAGELTEQLDGKEVKDERKDNQLES